MPPLRLSFRARAVVGLSVEQPEGAAREEQPLAQLPEAPPAVELSGSARGGADDAVVVGQGRREVGLVGEETVAAPVARAAVRGPEAAGGDGAAGHAEPAAAQDPVDAVRHAGAGAFAGRRGRLEGLVEADQGAELQGPDERRRRDVARLPAARVRPSPPACGARDDASLLCE